MKVIFLKSKAHPKFYMYSTPDKRVPIPNITSLLKSKFESIVFFNSGERWMYNYFNFDDPADEAAFLLWSSDWIEL
jgi:phenylalanyl-tRNA synthetase alpha subunit